MSLYNALHGVNSLAGFLLKILEIDQENGKYSSGRFRDIHLNDKGDEIILFTRNGGGNREEYQPLIDDLATHPNYLRDYDDDFDCTYAYIIFSVPEQWKEECKKLSTGKNPASVKENLDSIIAEMDKMSKEDFQKDPRFSKINEVMGKITDPENEQKIFEV